MSSSPLLRPILAAISSLLLLMQVSAQSTGFTSAAPATHALIVGISDYAHVEDLQYADRDALVFREYLLDVLPNKADSSRITVLLDEHAVSTAIYKALEDLVAMAKEGDRVYIYFSGHGDSENSTIFQSGFLLTYDTPTGSYYTNSVNVEILNHFISTLSVKNKSDVIFIADACRSGGGHPLGSGAVQTARSLTQHVADEVRMLSCQPEEVSLEGKQWGKGRGLFSFHLVNGLYGMADMPEQGDGKISLNELNMYLSMNVPRDAEPVSQYPGVYGPMAKVISIVQPDVLARLRSEGAGSNLTFTGTRSRGYEEQFLADLDEAQLKNYNAFRKCLTEDRLQHPDQDNAYHYFNLLEASGIDAVFASLLRRDLAAALLETPQLFIHQLADTETRWQTKDIRYGEWSNAILLSSELLGDDHYLHNTLIGKHHFFSAAQIYFKAKSVQQPGRQKAMALQAAAEIDKAIRTDPLVAFYFNLKGAAMTLAGKYPNAIASFDEAIRISPGYPYPYGNKGYAMMKAGQFEAAIPLLDACLERDPAYTTAYQYKITALKKLGREQEALDVYQQLIDARQLKGM